MIIYIVRHGQTAENLQMILQGHLPGTLTDKGKEQVRNAAEHLAEKDVQFKCIVSSDLKRAMDSANIISERLKLPVIPMEILRERDWGKYTGMPVSEAADKYKKDGKWMFPDGGAETEEDIYQRAGKALQELSEKFANDTIIVVTHGQFARNMIANHFECNYHDKHYWHKCKTLDILMVFALRHYKSYPKTSWLSATCLPLSMTNNPQKRTLSRKWQECVKPIVGTPSVKVRI